MDKIKEYPDWVCATCIRERGARIPEWHCPTWHKSTCDLCGIEDWVTEPRDCGKTRHLLDISPIIKYNGGIGAILCNKCHVIIKTHLTREEVEGKTDILYCEKCK